MEKENYNKRAYTVRFMCLLNTTNMVINLIHCDHIFFIKVVNMSWEAVTVSKICFCIFYITY